jgi:hypothetical protein
MWRNQTGNTTIPTSSTPGAYTIKLFTAIILPYRNKLVFTTTSHFHPNIILADNAGADQRRALYWAGV